MATMIDLGTTDFYIATPSMPSSEFERYSTHLFDIWEIHVGQILALPDYSLLLEIEEGSVKGVGRIGAVLGALYIAIGNYGDFVQGIQTIRSQVSSVGDYLADQAFNPFAQSSCKAKVRKRSGSLGQLQRLFNKVQSRELTPEQAMIEAEGIFSEEASSNPAFMCDLQKSLETLPLVHQQTSLLPGSTDEELEILTREVERKPRPSRQHPSAPPPQHIRVEVWRESKNDQRKVRVIQL
jgi:hypothetical protein